MGRFWRSRTFRCAAVLFAALVVPVTGAISATQQPGSVSTKLVGKWTRTVTQADVKREHSKDVAGEYVFIVKKNGDAVLGTTYGALSGKVVPAGANRVHINIDAPVQNVYTWHVSGRTLTFTKVKDAEPDRAVLVVGVWKRT